MKRGCVNVFCTNYAAMIVAKVSSAWLFEVVMHRIGFVTKDMWTRSPYFVFTIGEKIFTTSNLLLHICDFSLRIGKDFCYNNTFIELYPVSLNAWNNKYYE